MLILPAEGPNLPERGGKVSLSAPPSRLPSCGSGSWWPVAREEASRGSGSRESGGRGGSQQRLSSSSQWHTGPPGAPAPAGLSHLPVDRGASWTFGSEATKHIEDFLASVFLGPCSLWSPT